MLHQKCHDGFIRESAIESAVNRHSEGFMRPISLTLEILAAVGFILFALNGFSFAAEKKSAKPAPSISLVEGPTLSSEQFAKIKKRLEAFGKSGPISSKLTIALGATEGSEQMDVREVSFERDGYQHGFLQSRRFGDDRIIILFRTPEKNWMAFLTNTRFTLLSAATWNAGEQPTPLTPKEASEAFANELIYWATLSEIL
jgi:hypothetical protein